jgi:hypothetical protein
VFPLLGILCFRRLLRLDTCQQTATSVDTSLHGTDFGFYPLPTDILPLRLVSDMHCETVSESVQDTVGLDWVSGWYYSYVRFFSAIDSDGPQCEMNMQTDIARLGRLISIGGSASQLGFFVKTGGELDWRDATAYATSKEGLKVLFSGSEAVIACGIGLLIITIPIHGFFYRAFGAFIGAIGDNIISGSCLRCRLFWSAR